MYHDPNLYTVYFTNNEDSELLQKIKVAIQSLCLSKREKPDLRISTTFRCIRVNDPGKDEYRKLGRNIRYLEVILLPLIMKHGIIALWVDTFMEYTPIQIVTLGYN